MTAEVDVVLESAGDNKTHVIKVVPGLGVMAAKQLVESVPKPISEKVANWAGKAAKEKPEAAGAKVIVKRSGSEPATNTNSSRASG